MSARTTAETGFAAATFDAGAVTPRPRRFSFLGAFSALARLLIGVLLCAGPVTAVLVVGWTFRAMRRRVLRGWWDASPVRDALFFERELEARGDSSPARALPRWIMSERPIDRLKAPTASGDVPGPPRMFVRLPGALFGSLASNLVVGLKALFCTYLVTLPACGLWLGSWYDGWNTSFTKGYENAFVGLSTAFVAHALFIVAMIYVPMAWGHFAVTGRIGAFFQVRLIGRLIWRHPGRCALLALAFAVVTLPVMALRSAPIVLGQDEGLAAMEPAELLQFAELYELGGGVYVFFAFVGLHLLAARFYRAALLRSLASDPRLADLLPSDLRGALERFRLMPSPDVQTRNAMLPRIGQSAGGVVYRLPMLGLAAVLWFAVIAQVYVGQFLNYIPVAGWLNQPLIHLPSLQTTPQALRDAVEEAGQIEEAEVEPQPIGTPEVAAQPPSQFRRAQNEGRVSGRSGLSAAQSAFAVFGRRA